jgi:putative endonuclease
MPNNIELGNEGEEIASTYLVKKGFLILAKNWRYKHLEIDIIASINSTLVIVEVKLRSSDFFGNPEEFVTRAKQKKLIKAADFYIKENNINWETRFDIIAITKNHNALKVEHFEGAFYPGL